MKFVTEFYKVNNTFTSNQKQSKAIKNDLQQERTL